MSHGKIGVVDLWSNWEILALKDVEQDWKHHRSLQPEVWKIRAVSCASKEFSAML